MTMVFEDAEVPEDVVPSGDDNPYKGVVAEIKESGKAKTVKVRVPEGSTQPLKFHLDLQRRMMQAVGRELGVTVSTRVTGDPDKDAEVTILFWTRAKVTRPRKKKDTAGEPQSPAPEVPADVSASEVSEESASEPKVEDDQSPTSDDAPAQPAGERKRGSRFARA